METLLKDLRFGVRMLLKKPAFTVIAVLTLALGIGANTAIFSVVNTVLLRPLPFLHPEQLVRVTADLNRVNLTDVGVSGKELADYRDHADVFEQISGVYPINANITWVDQPERVEALLVDVNYFSMLGADVQLGRIFQADDYQPGIAEIAVISDGLWRRRYGADPNVLGKKFRLDNDLYEVVGVMPPGFRHPGRTLQNEVEVWAPSGWTAAPFNNPPRSARFLQGAIGRLKPGVSITAAQSRLEAMANDFRTQFPNDYPEQAGWSPRIIGLQEDLVGNVRPALLMLLAAVGLVLLIACANVANLLLVRASARQREIAIRRALGATRARLMRQFITESVLLALAGGALGLLVAVWGVAGLVKLSPANLVRLGSVGVDKYVLLFTLAVSLVTGILFGLVPAIQASNPDLQETLKDAARGATGGIRRNRVRNLLVVSEFALALMLLVSAALLIRSFRELQNVNPGFNPQNVLTARFWLPQPNQPDTGPYFKHPARLALYRRVMERVAGLPGVQAVGIVSQLPLGGGRSNAPFMIEGQPIDADSINTTQFFLASPGYFEALGIEMMQGRMFAESDDERAPGVVIIGQTMANRFFHNEDPIGKRLRIGGRQSQAPWMTIIGVVRDVKLEGLEVENKPQVYRPLSQASSLSMALALRATNPAALAEAVRAEVRAVDPDLPTYGIRTMEEVMALSVGQQRFAMALLGVFAFIALALSAVGIYGVMSYSVSQRTHEIGIRMALGAEAGDVLKLVLRQGLMLTVAGMAIGLVATFAVTRFLRFLLFGISPTDPLTFAAITIVLGVVALLACYIPARRATKVDPMIALRYE
jgi:putative ABC transport system permease protein